jgi:hypothetical protein
LERQEDGALVQTFGSYYDLLDTAANGQCEMSQRSSRRTNNSGFNDASSFEQALDRATYGWPENTRRLRELAASITDDVVQRVRITEFRRSEEDGIGVDLDCYLAGEPDCLLRLHEQPAPGCESVRIVLNACAAAHVGTEMLQAKGAAVAALAQALERAGKRVEIVVAAAIDGVGSSHLETYFPAKREDEPMQLDQLAFSVASGDILRRFIFAEWETLPANIRERFGIYPGGGYGHVAQLRHPGGANVVVGSGEGVSWTDARAARGWVLDQLKERGVVLTAA